MDDNKLQQDILRSLGSIQAELRGQRDLMNEHNNSLHRRINDIDKASEQRFEAAEERIAKLETTQQGLLIRTASAGGIAGAVATVMIELIKLKTGS